MREQKSVAVVYIWKYSEVSRMQTIFSKTINHHSSFFALLLAVNLMAPPPAVAVTEAQPATSMVVKLSGPSDGSSVLQSLIERVKMIKDYWYESTLTTFSEKGKAITESGRFYYKTPHMMRFEALKAGKRSGSVVVCQPDGKIRAKAGGLMGGLTLTLSPKSKLLRTSNGFNIVESDLSTLLESLRSAVKAGTKCLGTTSPSPYPGLTRAYILEFLDDSDQVSQRIALDTERKLPAEWTIFNNGKVFSLVQITKLAIDSNIADDMFFLGRDSEQQKGLSTSAIAVIDRLQEKVGAAGVGVLNRDILDELKKASSELKRTSNLLGQESLTEHPADSPEKSIWSNFGRDILLTRATKIEAIAESLREMQPAIQNVENNHPDCTGLTKQWLNDLDSIDQNIANLYAMFESDDPDPESIVREAANISTKQTDIDAVILKISESL